MPSIPRSPNNVYGESAKGLAANSPSLSAIYDYDAFAEHAQSSGYQRKPLRPYSYPTTRRCRRKATLWSPPSHPRLKEYDYEAQAQVVVSCWPSRDPIGERGGVNLYSVVWNDTVNSIDFLGLQEPGTTMFDSKDAAIIAGGEYAVGLSEAEFQERLDAFEKKNAGANWKNRSRIPPTKYREYCGKICCVGEGQDDTGKYYFQRAKKGNLAVPGGSAACNLSGAPSCNQDDHPAGSYHNHPPSDTKARLSPDDGRVGKNGKPPFGHPKGPGLPDGIPPGSPVGATQRDSDGTFSTQIYDPLAPQGNQISNFDH